jgi:hypothetical protein
MSAEIQAENQPRFRRLRRLAIPIIIELVVIAAVVVGLVVAVGVIESGSTPTTAPTGDEQARSRDDPILYGYGWVDQKAGIAHIPIQRAIDLVAQSGLPSRPASAQSATDDGLTIPSYSSSGTQPAQVLH